MFGALLLGLAASPARPQPAEVYLTEEQALRIAFPAGAAVEKKVVSFSAEQRAAIGKAASRKDVPGTFRYFVGLRGGEPVGYAVIEDCPGKIQPITYMVATDVAGTIRAVEILAFRESRGGEVRQAGWREQFVGLDAASPLRVGTDIRNIAGATISCRSVTDGVRLQLACLRALPRPPPTPAPPEPSDIGAQRPGPGPPFRRARLAMGTMLRITVHAETEARATAAFDAAFAEVDRLERILSDYREDSETSRLSRAAGGDFLPVSPELLDLLARSREIAADTGGAFDVAVGPLVALWRRAAEAGAPPSDVEIAAAREAGGPAAVETDPEHGRARLARAGGALDFGGIGKGYALDRAAAALEALGERRALLDFGGQFLALDPPPGETGWTVELRDARDPARIRGALRLARASLSTTADYERGLAIGGQRYSHVVDPRTGRPVEGMLGVSVVCASGTEADTLSTALYVLGKDAGAELARRRAVAALIVPAEGPEIENEAFRSLEVTAGEPR